MSEAIPGSGMIEFASQQVWWLVVGIAVVSAVLLGVGYSRARLPLSWKVGLFSLKLIGIVLLAICLLDPLLVKKKFQAGENIIALVFDTSASMQVEYEPGESLAKTVREEIERDRNQWFTRLTQDFQVKQYAVGGRLNAVTSVGELDFAANQSRLANGLQDIEGRYQNQPLAGVLLLSDGNASDAQLLAEISPAIPIYPVLPAGAADLFDLSIDRVSVAESAFEDAPIVINAVVSAGVASKDSADEIEASLTLDVLPNEDEEGSEVQSLSTQRVKLIAGEPTSVRFQVRPQEITQSAAKQGGWFFRLEMLCKDEEKSLEEATLANNSELLFIKRQQKKNRILYVAGRPNWEYKFFNRALSEDQEVHLVSLIRIARKEAKFDFRGRVGEEANSLFRGQDREVDEETESFDEAVLIRMNTRDQQELSGGFPKTKAELYEYDAIILDDIEAAFFSQDQQKLLDRFVAERGGGLIMLGGRDSYRHGDWHKSLLRDALPVYFDRAGNRTPQTYNWSLTREGLLEPWMRVRSTAVEEQQRLQSIPPLMIANEGTEPKPGARTFAEMTTESNQRMPAVVAHDYGQGRAAAVLPGDLWRWSMQRDSASEDDLAKSWRQMLRWLVAKVPQRIETSINDSALGTNQAKEIAIRIRDEEYKPQENATVKVVVTSPEKKSVELLAEPSLTEPGLFTTTYLPRQAGVYHGEVQITVVEEPVPEIRHFGWTSDPDREEYRQLAINREGLEAIAARSGGEVIEFKGLGDFVNGLPQKEMPVLEVEATPFWHSPLVLLLALACFAAEWGIRRWRGLP